MDEDAPVLLGRLDIKVLNNNPTINNQNNIGYTPPIAHFPELITTTVHHHHNQNTTSSSSNKSGNNNNNNNNKLIVEQQQIPEAASFINRDRSSWDVAALTAFRDGTSSSFSAADNNATSKNNNNKTQQITTAREAIASLLASGRLPGSSTSASAQSSSTSSPQNQQVPSTIEIMKSLDRFASNLGVVNDQEASALRSMHFLHLLGYQRLQQLDGNLQMLLEDEKKKKENTKNTSTSSVTETLLHQPFKMFDEKEKSSSTSSSAEWVSARSKLYDNILQLADKNNSETQSKGSFWSKQPTQKSSIEVQTSEEISGQGVVNWSHPENDKNSVGGKAIKADEKLECRFPSAAQASNENKYHLIVSVKKVIERERLVAATTASASSTNNNGENNGATAEEQWEAVKVDESAQIKIPITSARTIIGRSLSAGTIRERFSSSSSSSATTANEEDSSLVSNDPWHIDLSAAVRKLTNRLDHGLYISKEHFVLLLEEDGTFTILPCSRNMIRVNGAVVFAAPKKGLKADDDDGQNSSVITIGSGNTSPAGVVVQIRISSEK